MGRIINFLSASLFLAGATGSLYNYNNGLRILNQPVVRGYNQIQEQIDVLDRKINDSGNFETLENVRSGLIENKQIYSLENRASILEANAELDRTNTNYWICFGVGVFGLAGLFINRRMSAT